MITPKRLQRIAELTAELEQLMDAGTTFLYGPGGDLDIVGILIADRETSDAVMGQQAAEDLN